MKQESTICQYCNQSFLANCADLKRGRARFCSLTCFGANRTATTLPIPHNTSCTWCSKTFYRNDSQKKVSRSGLQFCSRVCKEKGQSIEGGIKEIQPKHYGDVLADYRVLALRYYPKICSICNYNKYEEVLTVHHIDCDRSNNDLSNLKVLCPTCHAETHYLEKSGYWSKRNKEA